MQEKLQKHSRILKATPAGYGMHVYCDITPKKNGMRRNNPVQFHVEDASVSSVGTRLSVSWHQLASVPISIFIDASILRSLDMVRVEVEVEDGGNLNLFLRAPGMSTL